MIIAITGTPGTGKSDIAGILAKQLNANLIEIKQLVGKMHCRTDKKRKTKIVDLKALQKIVNKKLVKNKTNIIEGHLSHKLNSDVIIVLRTNPSVLKKRLEQRKWSAAKMRENVQAEILGIIAAESMTRKKSKLFELDTSKLKPAAAAGTITKLLNNHLKGKYEIGHIDWSEKYKKELMEQ